jgi:hypothetical protein
MTPRALWHGLWDGFGGGMDWDGGRRIDGVLFFLLSRLELVASPTAAPCQHAVRSRMLLPSRRAGARFASDTYGGAATLFAPSY